MRRKVSRAVFVRGVPWPRVGRRHAWKGVSCIGDASPTLKGAGRLGELQESVCQDIPGLRPQSTCCNGCWRRES